MTWSYAQDIDGAGTGRASLAFGTDFGTIKICVSECGLSTKYAFDNSAYGIGSDKVMVVAQPLLQLCSMDLTLVHTITFSTMLADFLPLGMTFKADVTPGGSGGSANASFTL